MESSTHNLPGVFGELSRLNDGDHTIYVRTDSHNFFEIHRTGTRNLFTSTVAAFIPNVVVKLQTPLASSIIAAVPSRQGAPTLHTRSGLFIVEGLSDIVNFVKHHKAAFIREDATLAVWADEVQPALAALHQVLKELAIALDRHDLVRVMDPSSNALADPTADGDAFDEFIHNYDDPTNKPHDESAFLQGGCNALLPLRSLDGADTLEAMYTVSRANLFDSLSSGSLALGDSPFLSSAVSNDISRLCLDVAPQICLSPTFSTISFDFSSPSLSSGSSSDHSALSTPLTIAPSVLSSPHSMWSSPQLPATISESSVEEALQDALPVDSADLSSAAPSGSREELSTDTSSKRKRFPKAKQARPAEEEAIPEKPRSRCASLVPISAKAAPPLLPRACKTVSKAIAPSLPPSPRALCPLPERTRRTRSSSTSSTSSACSHSGPSRLSMMPALKAKRTRAPAAQLTIPRVTRAAHSESESEAEPEILESDDSGSEYEADPSELELDELDDEDDGDVDYDDYRPAKRARSFQSSPRAVSPSPSVPATPVRRKAVSPKLASEKKASKKKKSSGWSAGGSSKKKKAKAQSNGPPPTCVWCDKEFTRESDVLRHELHSCKLYPFERALWCCPLCDKVISRTDAVIRHQGSDDCKKRQRDQRDQGLLTADKVARKKAGARAATTAKAPLSSRRHPSYTVRL